MKVLSGVYPHGSYDGDILFEGEPVAVQGHPRRARRPASSSSTRSSRSSPSCRSPRTSSSATRPRRRGVINWDAANHQAIDLLARVGLRENPLTPVKHLGIGKQQLVEIAKALSKEVKLLILDEPTAALNDDDSTHLLDLLKGLQGKRHHLDHDQPQAQRDRARWPTPSRSFATAAPSRPSTSGPATSTRTASSAAWSAATSSTASPTTRPTSATCCSSSATGRSMHPQDHHREVIRDASLTVRHGEIVGHRRAHGRRPHRARAEHLRPVLRQPARGAAPPGAARRSRSERCSPPSAPASPTSARTARDWG